MSALYERIGGQAAVEAIADDFIDRLSGDAAYSAHFGALPPLKTKLGLWLMAMWGDTPDPDHDAAITAHAGLGLTQADFDAAVAHLQAAMEAYIPAVDATDIEEAVDMVKQIAGLAVTT